MSEINPSIQLALAELAGFYLGDPDLDSKFFDLLQQIENGAGLSPENPLIDPADLGDELLGLLEIIVHQDLFLQPDQGDQWFHAKELSFEGDQERWSFWIQTQAPD